MRKQLALTAVAIAVLLAGCTESAVSRAEGFHRYLDEGRISEALAMLEPAQVKEIGESRMRSALATGTEDFKRHGGIKSMSSTSEERGELATSEATILQGDGKTQIAKLKMVKINGQWYVDLKASAGR